MELLALLLSLVLSILKTGLSAPPLLLLTRQLYSLLSILLLRCIEGFASLDVKIILDPSFIANVSHPLLNREYHLDGLYKNNKEIRY